MNKYIIAVSVEGRRLVISSKKGVAFVKRIRVPIGEYLASIPRIKVQFPLRLKQEAGLLE